MKRTAEATFDLIEEVVEKVRSGEWTKLTGAIAVGMLFPRPLTHEDVERSHELLREHPNLDPDHDPSRCMYCRPALKASDDA